MQTAATHMENADLTIYLTCWEDARRAMREYVAVVIKGHEEHDAAMRQLPKRQMHRER